VLSDQGLQSAIAQSVLHRDDADIAPLLRAGSFDPLRRLNIYRNNTFASLTATLMAVFPVTVQLLGENYFRQVAGLFIRNNPPVEARLVRYGGNFGNFLARIEEIRAMPFVADTARLEWAIAEALDAAVLPACSLAELQTAEADVALEIHLQPSLRLLFSRWPALTIWSAHQAGGDLDALAAISRHPQRIAVWRNREAVRFLNLDRASFTFFHRLKKTADLEVAVSRTLAIEPEFDLAGPLCGLFADGLVARIRQTRPARM
jgi:hypothetical protein